MKETNRAKAAFEEYYAMGPGRSLRKLWHQYRHQTEPRPPTRRLKTLAVWSKEHGWQERVFKREKAIYDELQEKLKEQALNSGYAQAWRRLADLNQLAELLFDEILDEHRRWVKTYKGYGKGDDFTLVEIPFFNSPLVDQYRKLLDDIAAEMGERVKGLELTGKDGAPLFDVDEWKKGRLDRLESVQALEDPAAIAEGAEE